MATSRSYKKYMKKNTSKDYGLWKLFAISFFGMLLVFTFIIKSFSPSVDTSIGDYKQEPIYDNSEEIKKNVDNRLAMIQDEDQGRNFSELMKNPDDVVEAKKEVKEELKALSATATKKEENLDNTVIQESNEINNGIEPVYKVFIGSYSTPEQAKVVRDIIIESGSNLTPIVKCIGANNYTLQVGIFKNKTSAESLLYTIQQNHLPARIVQDY